MRRDHERPWWLIIALPLLILLLIPIVVIILVLWLVWSAALLVTVWMTWCRRGRYALVVYSNSPIWQDYFEMQVLPELGSRAIVLNWSERRKWRRSLAVSLFRAFSGGREFNPLAIVFVPANWPRRFRFFKAFQSFKRGRVEEVDAIRREFFDLLDALAPPSPRAERGRS